VAGHREQILFHDRYVCACRQHHSHLDDTLSLADYVALPHLLVSVQEDRVGRVDALLAEHQLKRHTALSVPHFLVAPSVLAETDLIATLARRIAQAFAQTHGLKLLPLPLELEEFAVRIRWHQSRQGSPADQWLRDQILTVSRQVDDAVADET
jgi:DNA-binding transcriptional LysR family regulator